MGKISILTKNQTTVLDQVSQNAYLRDRFYFTGGTVLAHYYLKHRYSDDLDFFSEQPYDPSVIDTFIRDFASKTKLTFSINRIEQLSRFELNFSKSEPLKIDFSYYPGKRIEKGKEINGFAIDSLRDIAVNKITTIQQRQNVKDYVDLYYLLKSYTLWDLIYGAKAKFNMEIEPWTLASDILYGVEKFDTLPRMIKPLSLLTLKKFYRNLAIQLGTKITQ